VVSSAQPTVRVVPFEDFYRQEFPSLVALATTMVGRSGEDIAQEALLKAHRDWSTISTYERPGAWVRRVAINLAKSKLRRRTTELKARLRLLGDLPRMEDVLSLNADVQAAITALPHQQRAAIALHYLEDRPVAEIAEILECAPATAKVHLHRGRVSLAARLGHDAPKEDPS
jgi:RNA polymerase sigma-70 factor (ECF subfamily)